jgi:hypothetical protein
MNNYYNNDFLRYIKNQLNKSFENKEISKLHIFHYLDKNTLSLFEINIDKNTIYI